eukprot:s3297_g1.t1
MTCYEEDPEDPEQVAADEAAAAKHDNITDAAYFGNLAAVRGHLRRDRRCLDQLFKVRGTRHAALHWAALRDHPAIVAFLLAKGAAVDVQDDDGPGAQSRRWESLWTVPWTDGSNLGRRKTSSAAPRGDRQAAVGREGLGGHQERRRQNPLGLCERGGGDGNRELADGQCMK